VRPGSSLLLTGPASRATFRVRRASSRVGAIKLSTPERLDYPRYHVVEIVQEYKYLGMLINRIGRGAHHEAGDECRAFAARKRRAKEPRLIGRPNLEIQW
jgi:hypothetical protein